MGRVTGTGLAHTEQAGAVVGGVLVAVRGLALVRVNKTRFCTSGSVTLVLSPCGLHTCSFSYVHIHSSILRAHAVNAHLQKCLHGKSCAGCDPLLSCP